LHILQLVSRFSPVHVGGIENAVLNLSRELVRKGHKVTVLTSSDSWDRVPEEIDGIRIMRLPCLFKLGYTSPFLPSFLLESIRTDPCDVIHAHIPDGFLSASSPIVSMMKSCPLVLTVHNFPLGETPSKLVLSRVLEYLLQFALYQADRIFVHNNSCVLLPQLRELRRKICVTPLGVDLKKFNPEIDGSLVRSELGLDSDPVILFVSVLDQAHWYKGLRLLIRSMRHLDPNMRDTKLVVVGSGDSLEEYRSYAKKLSIEERIIFTGYVQDSVLPNYYASSNLVVLPSVSRLEGFGLVVAEGMASGKSTIVSHLAGISDFLSGGTDTNILRSLDEYTLAETISCLLKDDKRRKLMGRRARETAESKFDWTRITEQILREYEQVTCIR
jgi:glycosyltransferase involved in cell wall biosynthesis